MYKPYSRFVWFGVSVVGATVLALLFVPSLIRAILSGTSFMPHATCYLNNRPLIWLHVISDSSIGIAYLGIAGALAYLVYKARKDIPFEWMFLAFGVFIFSCAWTHLLEVWTVWRPDYWFSGGIKAVTAVASVATALGLQPVMPRIFGMVQAAKSSEQRRVALEKAHAELEQKNRQLRELDDLKTQFFANVSHELRTPLALILGTAERLLAAENITSEQHHDLQGLRRNGRLLLKHVSDILDASKLEARAMTLSYREVDVAELIRVACSHFETLAEDKHVEYTIEAAGPRHVAADAEKLQRVLINLLVNAFKFVPDGGKVRCTLRMENDTFAIEVADSGPGIPPESRQIIFERFRQLEGGATRRFGGTGLGLSIAREFVELHGGKIQVDASPEGGALFRIVLPRKAPSDIPVQPADETPAPEPVTGQAEIEELRVARATVETPEPLVAADQPGTPVILVAEDNPDMNQMICRSLRQWGYVPVSAFDGAEALAKAKSYNPDLILTDVMMPRMGGEQLLQALQANGALARLPVVVLTARTDDDLRVRMLRAGAEDYLTKPFTVEELQVRVNNLIEVRRSQQELRRAYDEMEVFSYSLAHDIRAPLRGITSFAIILREDKRTALGADGLEMLERILASAKRLDRLVQDVLSYTRLMRAPVAVKRIDLDALVRGLIRERPEMQSPHGTVEIAGSMGAVLGDEASLTQCVANLLSNAIKYVAPGVHPHVRVWTEQSNGRTRLWIQDNGIGISPEEQKKLFVLFQRLHPPGEYEGTGVGLAIVRKAAERMGGKVGVESQKGAGSKFWVELRAAN